MTSQLYPFPLDYYSLSFCYPRGGSIKRDFQNVGEMLSGDRISNSLYFLEFQHDVYCQQVCVSNLGRREEPSHESNKFVKLVHLNYHHNWIVDNLPAGLRSEDFASASTAFGKGFPIGLVGDDGKAYVYNHVNIEVVYHAVPNREDDIYRIVQFFVQPFSIRYEIDDIWRSHNGPHSDIVKIRNPIQSCNRDHAEQYGYYNHTSHEMLLNTNMQLASGKVLFTYDVIWREEPRITWGNRWDAYLKLSKSDMPSFFATTSRLVGTLFLSIVVALLMCRKLRRDLVSYATTVGRAGAPEEDEEELEGASAGQYLWAVLYKNVFRPPSTAPMLLAACCGTGAQLLATLLSACFMYCLGFMNPARRGEIVRLPIYLYAGFGFVGGYTSARFYTTFHGESPRLTTLLTAGGFPCWSLLLLLSMDFAALYGLWSCAAVPIGTMFVLFLLWATILVPSAFLGASVGYARGGIHFPVRESVFSSRSFDERDPYAIPLMVLSGILPFASCAYEFNKVMDSLWIQEVYYAPLSLSSVCMVLLIITAETSVICHFVKLIRGRHRWWWQSFANGGGAALWMFAYCTQYYSRFQSSFSLRVFYYAFTLILCMGIFLMLGFVGLMASLVFNKRAFSSIKVESVLENDQPSEVEMETVPEVKARTEPLTSNTMGPVANES